MAYKTKAQQKQYYLDNREYLLRKNTEARRKRMFGVTPQMYEDMMVKQESRCAICKRAEDAVQQKSLCVDHDHETGEIRGLLCHACNVGLGRFMDSKTNLYSAIKYLNN